MAKITPENIADLKALFQDNEKALGANFSQLIDFFNNNKVTDNGDGTFTAGTVTVDASKLYDLINNSSPNILPLDNEFTGKNTFDIAPINKANGKPYITADSVPPVDLSNYATQQQLATKADDSKVLHNIPTLLPNGTNLNTVRISGDYQVSGAVNRPSNADDWTIYHVIALSSYNGVQISYNTNNNNLSIREFHNGNAFGDWKSLATTDDVATAINAATANMADTTKAANFTSGLQSGGINVATAADLKSVEDSAWRQLDNKYVQTVTGATVSPNTTILYKVDDVNKKLYIQGSVLTMSQNLVNATVNLNSIVKTVTGGHVRYLGLKYGYSNWTLIDADIRTPTSIVFSLNSGTAGIVNDIGNGSLSYITYDELV